MTTPAAPVRIGYVNAAAGQFSYTAPVTQASQGAILVAVTASLATADLEQVTDTAGNVYDLAGQTIEGAGPTGNPLWVYVARWPAAPLSPGDQVTATFTVDTVNINLAVFAAPWLMPGAPVTGNGNSLTPAMDTGPLPGATVAVLAFQRNGTEGPAWQPPATEVSPNMSGSGAGYLSAGWAPAGPEGLAIGTAFVNAARNYGLIVMPLMPDLAIVTSGLPDVTAGQRFRAVLEAGGGQEPYEWQVTGLPEGLAAAGPVISGFPAAAGAYHMAVTVTDARGQAATAELALMVMPAPLALVPVSWDGLDLNPGEQDSGLMAIVEDVDGWYGSPPLDGHNVDRTLADGVAPGPKTLGARAIAVTGAAAGPRDLLMALHNQIAVRANARQPVAFTVADPDMGAMTADVRADSDQLTHAWLGGRAGFRWQVTLTAADPRLWGEWREVTLLAAGDVVTGREYPRVPPWAYGGAALVNVAVLDNPGSAPAPVFATFTGRLQGNPNIQLVDGRGGVINLPEIGSGVSVDVNTETLAASAPGGASRASMILPGSTPMTVPAGAGVTEPQTTWALLATQDGSVRLRWRPAWV